MPERGLQRVLMTCDTVGGVWTFALELAEGLGENGVDVVLAALGGMPSSQQRDAAARIPNLSLLASDYKLEWMEDPWADVAASGRWLMDVAHEYSPDVVHLNSFGHGGLPFESPVVLTAHSCVLSWWQAVKGGAAPSAWDPYRTAVSRALLSATLVTTPSHFMADALAEHYGFSRTLPHVIPNGVHSARFHSVQKEPFIFTAGRLWDEAKNAAALADIAESLSWPVYMAGEGRIDSSQNGCHALGVLPARKIAGWYARAAIYALPAFYEPFGLSALEAGLSGCALVLGNIPSLREIWGEAALFVSPGDRRALRDVIQLLIDEPGLREEMARRSLEQAGKFSRSLMAGRYLDLYRMVACGRSLCVS